MAPLEGNNKALSPRKYCISYGEESTHINTYT